MDEMRLSEIFEYVTDEKHDYKKSSLYVKLKNLGFKNSLLALDVAGLYYGNDKRKDGITKSFDHPVSIARFIMKFIPHLMYPDETIAASILHDLSEDYDFPYELVKKYFGMRVRNAVELVTKEYKGVKIIPEVYFNNITHDPIASIVKGADRIHNLHTLTDFPQYKKDEQSDETEFWILPMLELSMEHFPKQEEIYKKFIQVIQRKIIKLR